MKCCLFFFCMAVTPGFLLAQSSNALSMGLAYEKEFKVSEALVWFEKAITEQPGDAEAYIHASRMLSTSSGRLPVSQREEKQRLLSKARKYAQHAIRLHPDNADARLAHIISLGLQSEISRSAEEKVTDARLIHQEATTILSLDSLYAEAFFVLGKWHLELSRLNWFELMACKVFLGGFPEDVSIEKSLRYFQKAMTLQPKSILFHYGLALAYIEIEDNETAAKILRAALQLPLQEPDDELRIIRCRNLLQQLAQD
jgi:tetratricopeptide (TPR) repeat protein